MTTSTIAQLNPAASLTGSELVPVSQGGVTLATSAQAIAQLAAVGGGIPGNLSIAQLTAQFTAANVNGFPTVTTADAGLQTWNGVAWVGGLTYTLLQTAVPMISPPSGTMGNNGAFTLGTALDKTYPSAYMWFWTGNIAAGISGGWYYVVMADTQHGTVFNNKYRFGQPLVPTAPTLFSTTGPGAWTNNVNTLITALTCNTPAFGVGLNGRYEVKFGWTASNTATAKAVAPIYGGASLSSDTETNGSTSGYTTTRTIINQGKLGAQLFTGVNGAGAAQGAITIDSTKSQSIWLYLNTEIAATDWIVIQYMMVQLVPSGELDAPPTPQVTPAGPAIVPPGAAALGYTTNVWFITPTASMVSIGGSTILQSVSSLDHYLTGTMYGVTGLFILQKGDGVNTACSTNTPSTLAPLLASQGMYFEAAVTLSSNHPDHWQSFFSDPTEKNGTGIFPFVEIDWMEQIGGRSATDPFNGNTTSAINWSSGSSGSPTTINNLSSALFFGPNVDWTLEHIVGGSYDPINEVIAYWMDGVQLPFTVSTSGFNNNVSPLHYFVVLQAASHTSGSGGVPYSMFVRYFSAWT